MIKGFVFLDKLCELFVDLLPLRLDFLVCVFLKSFKVGIQLQQGCPRLLIHLAQDCFLRSTLFVVTHRFKAGIKPGFSIIHLETSQS